MRAVGISQDVTERKRAETEFRRLHDEIELQRMRLFKATMTTVQDIVNNLLNGFLLVRLEGKAQPDASPPSDASRARQKNGGFKSIEDLGESRRVD